MSIKTHHNLTLFFDELLSDIKCQNETRSYIVGVLSKYKTTSVILTDKITLIFLQARNKHDFAAYQNIGDYIFFFHSIVAPNLEYSSKEYHNSIGRASYYSCYNLINRKWQLFDEMAENFTFLQNQIKSKIEIIKNQTYLEM
jgi:hypothetical protein